jgi:PAS domain S-box-containing protein
MLPASHDQRGETMTKNPDNPNRRDELRSRAVAHLKGPDAQSHPWADAAAALGVLYELASVPSTAPDALALLHELQVHQVEVDLQAEELRHSRVELETSLDRQVQLYDYAPMGHLTVDGNAVLRELNRTAAALLGFERDFLRGRSLESFLTPEGVSTLRAMLGRVTEGAPADFADLHLRVAQDGQTRCMHASACQDPAGGGFLIGMMGVTGAPATPAT